MYYPGHSAQGQWNDWATRFDDPNGLPFQGVVEFDPDVIAPALVVATDDTWKAIGPVGNQEGQPIQSVGAAWEAANPGWNSDLEYDDMAWQTADLIAPSEIWAPAGASPAYFRKTFSLDVVRPGTELLMSVDDDAIVYINGVEVLADVDSSSSDLGPLDVTQYLVPGTNLLAVKAQDAFGLAEHLRLAVFAPVPEPSTLALALSAGLTLALARQNLRRLGRPGQARR
ncbi:MAG: hypothetical protein K1X74_14585 [Pirellulales bacterium]|nr:hypothetical protein [Pirellulales bacterium]